MSETVWSSLQFPNSFPPLDRSGFTFEFLRRNDDYRFDYVEFSRRKRAVAKRNALNVLAIRWGLVFPSGS
ncbi:transcriptional regulator domain-containing protein [Agrobacterium rosae]|uniref:DUF6499 domain-containing protein n=1 Tax=Agrobacterium rosae TaxID=1972867 RepID=A0AAW9FMH1_9HYPH|nr:DUF6499 domain-containing protein [Agrobacterium rosae]MDX8304331.1 DUF6499 domain-containing protein [Agrobacterium rosae]